MTISGYDCWKRKALSGKLKNVGAETSSGSPFQIRGPETLKVRLPTADSRNIVVVIISVVIATYTLIE